MLSRYRERMHADTDVIISRAIEWATARLGSPAYATRCLAFVEDAIERANDIEVFGGDSASESAELYGATGAPSAPPRGAFVFYDAVGKIQGFERSWGHVGLSVGGGDVIHAWDRVRIDPFEDIERLSPAPGWGAPVWRGWVPIERVLRDARPATWAADTSPEDAALQQQRRSLGGSTPSS